MLANIIKNNIWRNNVIFIKDFLVLINQDLINDRQCIVFIHSVHIDYI